MAIHPQGKLLAALMLTFLFSGSEPAACPSDVVHMYVSTPDEAQKLVSALNCTGGGIFDVTWTGRVPISETFVVPNGSSLTITGAAGASPVGGNDVDVIDAEGTTHIFSVMGGREYFKPSTWTLYGSHTHTSFFSTSGDLNLANLVLTGGQERGELLGGWGGGAIEASGSAVKIYNCTFRNNTSLGTGGGAIYVSSSELRIGGTTEFVSNSAYDVIESQGGAIFVGGGELFISANVTFSRNTAYSGGAVYGGGAVVRIVGNVSFFENVAMDGGAMANVGGRLTLEGTTFALNTAGRHGGAVHRIERENWDRYSNCSFEENEARSDGGALYLGDGPTMEVTSSLFRQNVAEMSGGAVFNNGYLDARDVRFVGNAAAVKGMALYNTKVFNPYSVVFEGNHILCAPGTYAHEKADSTNGVGRYEVVCAGCKPTDLNHSTYSVDIVDATTIPDCKELPMGVSNGTTIATFCVKKGYHRLSITSGAIRECYQEDACLGGTDPDHYCAAHYEGPYCAICANDSAAGYAYSCHECSGDVAAMAMGLGVAVTAVVSLVVAVIVSDLVRVVGDEASGEDYERRTRRFWGSVLKYCHTAIVKAFPLTAVKSVVVVWQITTQLGSTARHIFPDQYKDFLSVIHPVNLDIGTFLSFWCFATPDFYARLLIATVGPLVALAFLSVTYFVAKKRNEHSEAAIRAVRHKHLSAASFVAFFVYSSVSFTIFQTFVCDSWDGVAYLQADYSLQCGTPRHLAFRAYAVAMLCVYPVGIPAALSWWMARNRRELQRSDRGTVTHLEPFSSLWSAYRPSRYYYEVVECVRRVMHAAIAVFVSPGSLAQMAVSFLLAVVLLFVSQALSPFEKRVDMWLYFWGNGVVVASMYVALLTEIDDEETDAPSSFGLALIAANILMAVAVLMESHFSIQNWRAERSPTATTTTTVELVAPI